ncbi:serine kinase [Altererythrobacter sp. TH136]|uniref:HPr kinase/phosphorylase n=1 Tax=Altererythrobacter sp. TH136 TaxID=2067415 RepID=UPI0011635C6F|nr:serine kinase [Altererythrobacter sp. TH136]QDM41691.1 serine kinase [Altererythrobacter sp. TH136]
MPLRVATAVAIGGRALLIEGVPGSGKSSLALALIDRGAALIGDDGVTLELRGAIVWASPAPATAGLIELRNVGIVSLPTTEAPVALVLDLRDDAPRFVERADPVELIGRSLPRLAFDPRGPAPAVRAEYALALHGHAEPASQIAAQPSHGTG